MAESLDHRCNTSLPLDFGSFAMTTSSFPELVATLPILPIESSGAVDKRPTCANSLCQKHQRAGSVGLVLLVVDLEIQAFRKDGKFKLFMPVMGCGYS